ncbi:HTH-type transcriptional regulator LutR [bioreactor metagenome]|uniref:HTH-type transcriptional regulator LutR n=1 Tax=bioreactor metagenome TaxID=1076179 RepID=A0A645BD43_9ZZZZ
MAQNFKRIKKGTLSQSIIEQIKKMIENEELKPGDTLPSERELAEMLGVSRPPLREALHALNALGVIEIRAGEGTFLSENIDIISDQIMLKNLLSKYKAKDLIDARRLLEVEIARLASKKLSPESRQEIREAHENFVSVCNNGNVNDFVNADFCFHMALAVASENAVLCEMLSAIRKLTYEVNLIAYRSPGQNGKTLAYHEKIMETIFAGDEEQAQTVMRDHIDSILPAVDKVIAEKQAKHSKS